MSDTRVRLAIQSNGRLREQCLRLVERCDIAIPPIPERTLLVRARNVPLEVVFVRHSDIPRYVQSGAIEYGIVGANILYEYEPNVVQLQQLDFGNCRLVIAVPEDSPITTIADLPGHRIATTYPNSLRKWLRANHLAASLIEIRGSVEVAPELNLADAVCDITQTGTTLRTHHLRPLHTIFESQAVLIQSPLYEPTNFNLNQLFTTAYAK